MSFWYMFLCTGIPGPCAVTAQLPEGGKKRLVLLFLLSLLPDGAEEEGDV